MRIRGRHIHFPTEVAKVFIELRSHSSSIFGLEGIPAYFSLHLTVALRAKPELLTIGLPDIVLPLDWHAAHTTSARVHDDREQDQYPEYHACCNDAFHTPTLVSVAPWESGDRIVRNN